MVKVYASKAGTSRSTKYKKKMYKKRTWKKKWRPVIPGISKKTHSFKRFGQDVDRIYPALSEVGSTNLHTEEFTFALNKVQGYENFTALYDQYRIKAVSCKFSPGALNTHSTSSNVSPYSKSMQLLTVIDYDDDTPFSSQTQAREYSTCQIHQYGNDSKDFTRYFTPSCLTRIYESLTTDGFSTKFGQWISTNDPTTPHYGLKCLLRTDDVSFTSSDVNFGWTLQVCYYLEFRNSK